MRFERITGSEEARIVKMATSTSSATSAPAPSSSSSSSSAHSSKRVGQVKTNSKLNLISPRSFKFPGEKLLKKIGSASISKEKENTLTLSTSVATRRGRPKRHHSLDDLDDSMRRNVSFGRKGNKARDAIASDSEEDKASLWDGSYGDDDTSSSHSSDTDSDDWRDPTWVLDEWEEEERRLWREKKQREKEELERREREAAGLPPLPPSADSESAAAGAAVRLTSTETSSETASSENLSTMTSASKSTSTPTSPTPASKAASHQRRNSRVEIIVATDPLKQTKNESESESDRVRSSSREWPLRRARSFSETGEAGRVVKSKLDPGMKKRSLSSHSLPSSVDKQQQQQLKRRVSHDDAVNGDDSDNDNKSASSKRERKRKNSIKRKSGSGIFSTFAGIKHSSTDGGSGSGSGANNEGSGFLQSVKRRGRSLSGKGKGVDKERVVVDKERVDRDRDKEQAVGVGDGVRSPTTQKLSRSDEKVRSQAAGQAAAGGFDLDDLRSPRHSVCVTRPTATSPAHSHAHAYSSGASPSNKAPPTATKLFPKRERASSSSAPYVPRLKLPSHAPAAPKSYFSAGSSSSASLSPVPSPLTSPAAVSKSTTSLPYHHSGGGDATVSSLPSSPRSGFLNTTPASSPSSPYLHMPHRTPPLSPKGDKFSSKSGSRQGKHRSSSLSGASGSEGEAERLTWSNVWQSTTIEREMEIEAEVELEMEIEERARSDELELPGLGLGTSWQPIALQQRTDSRERVSHRGEREKMSTSTTATTPSEVKKRSDRHSGGAVATTASSAGLEMRSPEVLRWSGEMSRRSYRRSSLTGSQPAPPGVSSKPDAREEALAAREEALREHEEKVRQERDEFERERSEWQHEREKLLLELKRMRILQQEGIAGTTIGVMAPMPNDRLLWSPQHDLSTVVGNNAAAARQKSEEKAKAKTKAEAEKNEDEEGEGENEEEEETAAACAHCREKEETIRKLERDLKRIKYLYYEANGKLMESTMRDKNRDRHQLSGSSGGSSGASASLHRSDSAESASGMAATTPRSRQLKETASLIFHESSSKSKHRKSSERGHTPRGSPVSPRSAGSPSSKS